MWAIWAKNLPEVLKSCPKYNKSPNLVALVAADAATYYILTSSFTIVLHHHQDPFTLAAGGIGVSLWPV